MNTIGYFVIQSSDPARDIKFYETVFGWKFIKEEFAAIEYYALVDSLPARATDLEITLMPIEDGMMFKGGAAEQMRELVKKGTFGFGVGDNCHIIYDKLPYIC
jgi:hypothetical protein